MIVHYWKRVICANLSIVIMVCMWHVCLSVYVYVMMYVYFHFVMATARQEYGRNLIDNIDEYTARNMKDIKRERENSSHHQ